MKGNNVILFNHASAEEAFEEAINKRASGGHQVKVMSVSYDAPHCTFKVTVAERTNEEPTNG